MVNPLLFLGLLSLTFATPCAYLTSSRLTSTKDLLCFVSSAPRRVVERGQTIDLLQVLKAAAQTESAMEYTICLISAQISQAMAVLGGLSR